MFEMSNAILFLCTVDYKIIKKIGEGTFSEVTRVQNLKDGKHYACKTMKQSINRYAEVLVPSLLYIILKQNKTRDTHFPVPLPALGSPW